MLLVSLLYLSLIYFLKLLSRFPLARRGIARSLIWLELLIWMSRVLTFSNLVLPAALEQLNLFLCWVGRPILVAGMNTLSRS
jgi:hypothetical protein